jgi:hypothetical protein
MWRRRVPPRSFCSEHNSIPCSCFFIVLCFRQTPRLSSQVFLSFAILKSALNSFRCCIALCVCPCRKLQQSCTYCFNVTTWHVWSQTHTSSILKVYNYEAKFVNSTLCTSLFNFFPVYSALILFFFVFFASPLTPCSFVFYVLLFQLLTPPSQKISREKEEKNLVRRQVGISDHVGWGVAQWWV